MEGLIFKIGVPLSVMFYVAVDGLVVMDLHDVFQRTEFEGVRGVKPAFPLDQVISKSRTDDVCLVVSERSPHYPSNGFASVVLVLASINLLDL